MAERQQELRKSTRRWTRRNAEISLGALSSRLPCTIIDLSDGGARLAVGPASVNLPRHLTLVMFRDGSLQRDCEIVWNDRSYVGVKFVSEWYGALKPGQPI